MLGRVLVAYAAVLAAASCAVYTHAKLGEVPLADQTIVTSTWASGVLVSRSFGKGPAAPPTDSQVVQEVVEGEAALPRDSRLLAFALLPGKDGVRARVDGREAVVTVDDLLAHGAYEHAFVDPGTGLGFGTDPTVVYALLAERLAVDVSTVATRADLTRLRFRRIVSRERTAPPPPRLNEAVAKQAIAEFALHLARGVSADGHYAYLVDATSGLPDASYNWPRHSGATYFLAQAARVTGNPIVTNACKRAAAQLRDVLFVGCGSEKCIADGDIADLGSSALATLAFTEIDASGIDPGYRPTIRALTSFLRTQQRPDGEFMHFYDRTIAKPIDIQVLYYTGEATFALARAHRVTGDEEALAAAKKGLSRLGSSWEFFGSRYYYGEEHWTCQAAADLVDRSDDRSALDFCKRWHQYTRAIQYREGETPFDAAGGFGVGPLIPPRLTAASSRSEAAGALLDALQKTSPDDGDIPALEDELRNALEFVLRLRIGPDSAHLFARPVEVVGRLPGSAVDWKLRIDYEQHAGSALVRWLALEEAKKGH
jgi:hypothetical protein